MMREKSNPPAERASAGRLERAREHIFDLRELPWTVEGLHARDVMWCHQKG